MDPELITQIGTTTGPIGTIVVFCFMWLRSALLKITDQLTKVKAELQQGTKDRAALDRRVYALEIRCPRSVPAPMGHTPVEGVRQ